MLKRQTLNLQDVGSNPIVPAMKKIDIRALKIGEWVDDIPVVRCSVCGQSAIDLGSIDGDGNPLTDQTFAHVVSLTKYRGEVFESCHKQLDTGYGAIRKA